MSRTIRRKNYQSYDGVLPEYLLYSDKYRFNAPKWFRQELNKKFRANNNMILHHLNRYNDNALCNDIILFIPFKKNANYNYW